ncbi:MAG: putative glutathione S-transferase [Colwellia sp.]|jgi:putative glutathione S-transferase
MISISIVNAFMGDEGWAFAPGQGVVADPILNAINVHEIYTRAQVD